MEKLPCYHRHWGNDNDTTNLFHFDIQHWYTLNNDTLGSFAAQTAKDVEALENYVKWEAVERLQKKGELLEKRDGSWMILEMANDKVEAGIYRRPEVPTKLDLGIHSYVHTGWFTVYDKKVFNIILRKRWVRNIHGMYHIYHWINQMWITQ